MNDKEIIQGIHAIKNAVNNSEYQNVEVDGINTRDYPDLADAYVSYAEHSSTGEPLTDEELDELNENHSDWVHELALEKAIGA